MARKIVDIGVAGNDGTGDSIREAFRKTNDNFQEIYAVFGQGGFLKFTDLSDTPDSMLGEGGKLPVINDAGGAFVFKGFSSPTGTISVTQTDTEIQIDTLSSKLEDDPLPKLTYGMNASNQVIGGLRSPTTTQDFIASVNDFNTQHDTDYSIDTFAINKGYADARYINSAGDIMTGALSVPAGAAGNEVPRASETVLKTGAEMSGALFLNDHPGGLAGAGTPTGDDDLQAATKYYVDNSSYTSLINLYVSTQGDDNQSYTPLGKEGRSYGFAYRSLNAAAQKAEELMNNAPLEPGPYRQLIAYGGGEGFSEVTQVTVGSNGTTRLFFSNNSGARVDQGALPQPDIVPGKLVVGRDSGAKGIIYQYYGVDESSDYLDLQDVEGTFVLGENLFFDQPVRKLQISIIVESGIYEEDYPIRIPPNVAIVGEELRRVIVRPADRVSRSPWATVWFRRDKTFDGLTLTSTEFGYHYLTDPSDPLSEPKNNRDMDVFLCNDAVIIRQITCQGHGGFMMVLDPEGQILSKSAYIQQAGSFAQSLNKQRFAGGQYVDGFAGNTPLQVIEKFEGSNTALLVTGSERAPQTPCSFVIDGDKFKIDAFTDDGNGFGGARYLIRKNKEFIKAEVIGYINTELNPSFTYNRDTCKRDIGLIVDSLGYDLALGSNFNSIRAGQAYFRGTQYDILPAQLTQTNQALEFVREKAAVVVSGNSVAVSRVDTDLDIIINLINSRNSAVPSLVYPDPTDLDAGFRNARRLILANKTFIQNEVLAWVSSQVAGGNPPFVDFTYDSSSWARKIGYIVDALVYDLTYGGNLETTNAAAEYFDAAGEFYNVDEQQAILAAYTHLRSFIDEVARGQSFVKTGTNPISQDTSGTGGSIAAGGFAQDRIQEIYATINSDGILATPIVPSTAWVNISLVAAKNALDDANPTLQTDVINYINTAYSALVYDETLWEDKVYTIVDALSYDLAFGGNYRSVSAASSFYRSFVSTASLAEKEALLASMTFLKTEAAAVVLANSTAVSSVADNMDIVIDILTYGVDGFDQIVLPNPPGLDTTVANSKALLLNNIDFLKAEVIAFINTTYPSFLYDTEKFARETEFMIYAAAYDLIYGGNSATVDVGQQYYDGNGNLLIPGQTVQTTQAITYLKNLVAQVVVSSTVLYPKQFVYTQVEDLVNPGDSTSAVTLSNLFVTINTIILGGRVASPIIEYPTFAGIDSSLTDIRALLLDAKASIQSDTIVYLDQTYAYDQSKCARDTGYIVEAIAHDIYYSGNLKTVQAGLSYFNASASSKIVIESQLDNTIAAFNYIESVITSVVNNTSPTTRYQQGVVQFIDTAVTDGNTAVTKIGDLFDELLSILDAPPNARDARSLLVANKEFIKAEVIKYINYNYVSFTYDKAKCARDVGYIVDALGYDIMFGSNFQSVIAGRSYYRANASVAVGSQKAATLDAFGYLKTLVISAVTGNATAVTSVTDNMDTILAIIDNGLISVPAFVTPTPTGGSNNAFDSGYLNSRNLIDANRLFIEEEVIRFITDNYPALDYDPGTCRRDIGYILDAMYYDLTYGGNLQTLIAANSYYANAILQVAPGEKLATLAAYGYLKDLVTEIAINLDVTQLQNVVTQVTGTAGSVAASTAAGVLIDVIITTIDTGTAPATVTPNTSWVNAGLISAYSDLTSIRGVLQTQVTDYVDANYGSDFVYNEEICARDTGFIIANVSSDLLYGGSYNTIRAARRYHVGTVSSKVVINEQLSETLDALDYARQLAVNVLNQTSPEFNYQELTGVAVGDRVLQFVNSDLDGSSSVAALNDLMALLNALIADPELVITSQLATAKEIVYPTYKLVISDGTPITNELEYTLSGFVSKGESTVGDGSWDVVFSIPAQTVAPLPKTRYQISGNSNVNYNDDVIECVSSTTSSMTFRYPSDPGTFGTGVTTVTYLNNFMTLSAGNTSMCSNDFTQINDLGYGLVATNIGLIETVSVFTYYCWTAYYANNGGQIRSLNGSNAHGQYGIISAGSDPLEVPDTANLSDNMIQVAQVYKTGTYATDNVADDIAVYVYNHNYAPYNVSELEINHGAGLIVSLNNASLVGGSQYTPLSGTATYVNVPLTGGTGVGATADITITNGTVVLASIRSQGLQYTVGDTLSVDRANIGGGSTGAGFVIPVGSIEGNGIARYEVASVTDVSSTIPSSILTVNKTGAGPWSVTYTFSDVGYTPKINIPYTVGGSTNTLFNGAYTATASTPTSVTLTYNINPGTWGGGTASLWGRGNIIRLNLSTGGNNDTSSAGLATALSHNQMIIIRGNQNFKFYEVDDTNPTRPSTALTYVNDPNGAGSDAIVYRVLAYGSKGPLNENLAVDEAILGADTTYDYIKILVAGDFTDVSDSLNPGKTLGATRGDTAIAVDRVNETSVEARLNSSDMILAWDGKMHIIESYVDLGLAAGYAIIRISDIAGLDLNSPSTVGLQSPVAPGYNLNLAEPPTLRAGLAATEAAEIVVRISTCRVTGHDFLDIGTGGYNQTNYPTKIYGAPRTPDQAKEVQERTRGRVFYVTTDQNGIFRVGRFFTVDQGTGRVTFAASIALSNLDGLGFKRGVTVSEFSNDDKFTDGANDALPTEAATQGYLDRRLGMDRTSSLLPDTELIGPGYLDRTGLLGFVGPDPLNMGGNLISNVGAPASGSDAANKTYVDQQELSDVRVDTTTVPAKTVNDLLVYNGSQWVNAETITTGDIQTSLSDKNLALNIKSNVIINADVNADAEILQNKLLMQLATTRAAAPTGTARQKQATTGLSSFKSTEFTITDGFVEYQTSTSATTGVTLGKIQQIGVNTILGNLTGAAASPSQLTPGNVVTAGDGIKNASFAPGTVGTEGRVMLLTGITPNTYSTTNVTVDGATSSIVKTDSSGFINVKGVQVDGYTILDTSSTTISMTTPGGGSALQSVGAAGSVITTMSGTVNVGAFSTSSTSTMSPANANVSISPTGSGTVTIAPATTGTINNLNIGSTTRGTAAFTTLAANSSVTFTANTASNGTGSGTVVVTGGVGVSGRLSAANVVTTDLSVTNTISGSVNGNAVTAGGLAVATGRNNAANQIVRTDGSGYIQCGYINSSSGNENNASNPGRIWGTNGSDDYLRTYQNNSVRVGYANYADEATNNLFYVRGNSPTIHFVDNDQGQTRSVHHNSALIGFLSSGGAWIMNVNDSGTVSATTFSGRATSANYADLAEKYMADAVYETGTVVVFGGSEEITVTDKHNDTRVAGVISEKPAHLMNAELAGECALAVGLTGRLPCKVIGKVKKGDILVSAAKKGYAVVNNSPLAGTVIGKSLGNKDDLGEGLVEIVVGRF